MRMSDQGVDFVARHEGTVLKAYKDPVGVVTIGCGFTNGSRVAVRELGRIKLGMRITREQCMSVLRSCLDEEYGPAVTRSIAPRQQNHHDGAASPCFNLGPGSLDWKWARALAAGRVAESARLLRTTGTTAKGRKLPGLIRRRQEEARLIEVGDYGSGTFPTFEGTTEKETGKGDDILREYQVKLRELGYDPGALDGLRGPKTEAAVRAFQRDHPQLLEDGILGRATMAQIDRVADLRRKAASQPAAAGAVAGGGVAAGTPVADPSAGGADLAFWGGIVGIVAALIVLGYLAWRYRDEVSIAVRSWRRQ